MSVEKQKRLLTSLEVGSSGEEHRALIEVAKDQNITELVHSFPKAQHETLFTFVHEHLNFIIQRGRINPEGDATKQEQKEALEAIHILYQIVDASLGLSSSDAKTKSISATLFQSVQLFHDSLLSLPHPQAATLQNNLSMMFERLYTKQYKIRPTVAVADISQMSFDGLLPMTLSYLLLRALEPDTSHVAGSKDASSNGGKKSDILRVYSMKQGFMAFDYEDESSDTIKQLLIRCMIHPLFLRLVEGRRFLSFIFVSLGQESAKASRDMMRMFHQAMKFQLPNQKQSLIVSYADIYVRAWRIVSGGSSDGAASASLAAGQQLQTFEEDIIQDLMHTAVHASHPKTSAALQALLSASWHDQVIKKSPRVEEMLSRLYEPILWRAIKAANPLVRRHAVEIFIDVFPLIQTNDGPANAAASTSSFASNDELLQYQFDTLLSLLNDTDLGIRVLAISGICKILGQFWEMLPLHVSKSLVLKLVNDMVHDSSAGSSASRVAVFKGLAYILDNVLSHGLMKIVLPTLKEYIFDSSEAVQSAFIDMLHVVKKIKGIKYFEILPLEDLMLAIQTNSNIKIIHKLLSLCLNSYFPASKPIDSVLTRCFTLLRSHPHVFTIMMYYLHQQESIVTSDKRWEFIQGLYKLVVKNVKEQRKVFGKKQVESKEDDEEESKPKSKKSKVGDASLNTLSLDVNSELCHYETILSCLVVLYKNMNFELDGDENDPEIHESILATFNDGSLSLLLATLGTQSSSIRMNLLHLSSLLPDVCSPDLHSISLPHLLSLPAGAPLVEYGPILECMIAWGRTEEVMEHCAVSLGVALQQEMKSDDEKGENLFSFPMNSPENLKKLATFRASYQARQQEILAAVSHEKKSKKKAKKAAASTHPDDDCSKILLHPTLALTYLTYLFEHEKTRGVVLQEGVEWKMPSAEEPSAPSGGRVVGFLAEIVSTLSTKLIPTFKSFVENELGNDDLDDAKKAMMNFLSQAVQVEMKMNLHLHARLKLLAQRANQLAQEQAEAAAAEKAALAEENGGEDIMNESSSSSASTVILPAVTHIEMFPMNYEQMMEFTSYILLPLWRLTVTDQVKSISQPASVKDEDVKEESASKKKKKSKKNAKSDESAAATKQVFKLNSLSDFMCTHMSFISKFSTEMITLGYFHPQCPLQHLQSWMTHFMDLSAESTSKNSFNFTTIKFMEEFLPTMFKAFYQLSVIGSMTPGFGSKEDISNLHFSHDIKNLSFHAYARFYHSLITLVTSLSQDSINMLLAHANIKNAFSETLKMFQTQSRVLPRLVWMMLESVVDDEKYSTMNHENMLPSKSITSTAELSNFSLLHLSNLAKSPSCFFTLPAVIGLFTEQLAVNSPKNESIMIQRMGVAVNALALLAEAHVKINKKRHNFLSTLLECTNSLSSLVASNSADLPTASIPTAAPAPSISSASVAVSAASTASAMSTGDPNEPCPMELDGDTPVKSKKKVQVKVESMEIVDDKENVSSGQLNIQPSLLSTDEKSKKTSLKKSAKSQPIVINEQQSTSDNDSQAMWNQLKNRLTQQMQSLAV